MFNFFLKKTKFHLFLATFLAIFIFLSLFSLAQLVKAASISSDAIAIRVIPNPNYYSALRWYQEQGFSGSPQSLIVDGYEAVRDGRTVYVNAANVVGSTLYANIYLISYNQEAESATIDIFGRILSHWQFNSNLAKGQTISGQPAECSQNSSIRCISDQDCLGQGFCNSAKSQVTRDTIRLARMYDIDLLITEYGQRNGYYPILASGTYLPNITISVWPSWQQTLAQALGASLSIDPLNKLAPCPGFDPITCWDEYQQSFTWPDQISNATLPANNHVFLYQAESNGADFTLCAFSETGMIDPAKSCNSVCIPFCFDKECGDDSCGGTCLPGCSAPEFCVDGTCYISCSTAPGCRSSLANAYIVGGYCASGYCYECNIGYSWNGSSCVCTPDCSCSATTCIGNTCPDGCGGTCAGTMSCCTPDCTGKECGDDGCGGSCGTCGGGEICNASGQCVCAPNCTGKECGDDGCGGSCGTCGAGEVCNVSGQCICVPDCAGKVCGDDGCGGSCGTCGPHETCNASGQCVCAPDCAGRECGSDGCGGSCGTCGGGETCNASGQCVCAPNCTGKECGDDGCGGSCGTCGAGEICNASGQCICPSVIINSIANATIYAAPSGATLPFYHGPTLFNTTASITDAQTVTYSLSGNPGWLTIDSSTGQMQGTQTSNTSNTYTITVTATNACGSSDNTSFILTVLPNEWCGDSAVNGSEQCDGSDLGGEDCISQGFAGGGILSCNASCNFDTSGCSGVVYCQFDASSYNNCQFQ